MRDPIAEFMNYNRPFGLRNPELLRFKIARMAESPFAFFRGTFHLFARDVLDRACGPASLFAGGGEVDLVGDIHSENYGTYKAGDGVVHYDINDFDETTRGRFDFDVCRMATSLFLAARERHDPLASAVQLPLAFLARYTETVRRLVKKGREPEYDVSEQSPSGSPPVDDLIQAMAAVKRADFINKLTKVADGHHKIVRSQHYFNLPGSEEQQAVRLVADYRKRMPEPPAPDFYEVEDVCGRVAGIGSMGRLRYAVLVAGKAKREGRNVLLEFKEARPSAYDLYRQRDTDPAALAARAQRVVAVQRASQAASASLLGFAEDGALSFQAREIGPHDARVDFKAVKNPAKLEGVAQVQAGILARTHARSAARAVGPTNALAELEDVERFTMRVVAFVLGYADVVEGDYAQFVGRRTEIDDIARWAGAPTG
jgi:uncharacterized protein (DUF2252 family)